MNLHGFAFLGAEGDPSHAVSYQAFLRAVKQFGAESHHPELVSAPYAATGLSAGGGFASTLLTRDPDRVIAAGIICARYNLDAFDPPKPPSPGNPPKSPAPAAVLAVPSCLITGETEHGASFVAPVFQPYRARGALFSWLEVQGQGHAFYGQQVLAMPLLDAAVRARYPADADVLKGPTGGGGQRLGRRSLDVEEWPHPDRSRSAIQGRSRPYELAAEW